ncbi:MAG: hypothetical protein Q7R98_01655 [Candidatus Jorgensenbacteria bacterium]|nr:hypothetical protein [Candidatus Jorgensenbacteria bacterium]
MKKVKDAIITFAFILLIRFKIIKEKMNKKEKYDIAFRMATRASTGLSFIKNYLDSERCRLDGSAYLRSLYILLSYNTELILKSRIVMKDNFLNKNEVNKKLKALLHNIEKMGKDIGNAELLKLGINTITKNGDKYIFITTDKKEIYIEDFADIRYDFIEGKTRTTDGQEYERINGYTEQLRSILQKTKEENDKDAKA